MNQTTLNHVNNVLHHLYISPLEQCNLCCRMCYTTKSSGRLAATRILDFVHRYHREIPIHSITFCGGEVFILPDFVPLVNQLTQEGLFVQIITNGTIDKLAEFTTPNLVNLIVSLDGLPAYHDQNRGPNRWQQSTAFLKKALGLGFHGEVFSIVTKENMPDIALFERQLVKILGRSVDVTYHPRKPLAYLHHHPTSNRLGDTTGFSFITSSERNQLASQKNIFPPKDLGCYQISVMSDGQVYGCCEGIRPLGSMDTDITQLIAVFKRRIKEKGALGCVEPDFICGLQETEKQCP